MTAQRNIKERTFTQLQYLKDEIKAVEDEREEVGKRILDEMIGQNGKLRVEVLKRA